VQAMRPNDYTIAVAAAAAAAASSADCAA